MEIGEFEQFIGQVRIGNKEKMLEITIPTKLATFMGLQPGDTVKVMIKKIAKEEQNQDKE